MLSAKEQYSTSATAIVVDNNERTVRPNSVVVSKKLAKQLNLRKGSFVKIQGHSKSTYVPVSGIGKNDEDSHYVIADGLTRINAGISPAEEVEITRIDEIPDATRVVIGPSSDEHTLEADSPRLKNLLHGNVVCDAQRFELPTVSFGVGENDGDHTVLILNVKPGGLAMITPDTELVVKAEYQQIDSVSSSITYDNLGGLQMQIEMMRYYGIIPMKNQATMKKLGVDAPKGILLTGPPGTGKSKFVMATANESGFYFETLSAMDVSGPDGPRTIREAFATAREHAPAIVFVDEFDLLTTKRENAFDPDSKKILSTFLEQMDGIKDRGDILVLAATNKQDALDSALRRPGRFDIEIDFPIPDEKARLQILRVHTRKMPLAKNVDLEKLAASTHGFSGADLKSGTNYTGIEFLRRNQGKITPDNIVEHLDDIEITMQDLTNGFKKVNPSLGREFFTEIANVSWDDVAGLDSVKKMLEEEIVNILQYKKEFEGDGITFSGKIILYGDPGIGKTYLAKALAKKLDLKVIVVTPDMILSKWYGEAEQNVKRVFDIARKSSPIMMIWEEGDALGASRSSPDGSSGASARVLNQILTEIDGVKPSSDIIMIMTTNRIDLIDPALKRPGRFTKHIALNMPDQKGREEILKVHTKGLPLAPDIDYARLAALTKDDSPAALEQAAKQAGILWANELITKSKSEGIPLKELKKGSRITQRHLELAVDILHRTRREER